VIPVDSAKETDIRTQTRTQLAGMSAELALSKIEGPVGS